MDIDRVEAQPFHCLVRGRMDGFEAYFTLVYVFNTFQQTKALWTSLVDISMHMTKPWIVSGDFNAMLYTQDMMYGNPVTTNEMADFSYCIHTLLLNELPWKGDY